jgi:cell pole-organizing protein PopZ
MENAQPEPSMEEILASIRRIISEDEEEAAAPASPAASAPKLEEARKPEPVAAPAAEPASAPEPAADEDGAKPHLETEDVEMIKKNVAEAMQQDAEEAILDETAASAASSAFANLSQSVRVSEGPGRTLEDIVVEMLKPMVKEWLDANLPAIVEEKVEEEVQRVARRRR